MYRAGIDVGGTFTDCVLIEDATGQVTVAKVPSTPENPAEGFLRGLRRVCAAAGIRLGDVGFLSHGTTVATNALLEGRMARVAMVTTRGFRDVLEIGTQMRPQPYSLFQQKAPPLVPRRLRLDVPERVGPGGQVVEPLDEPAAAAALAVLDGAEVDAVAVCLLFSFANPQHERRVRDLVARTLPGVYCCISAEVCPEFREYPRFSTTVINAGLAPVVASYLRQIEADLARDGLGGGLHVMQSNGGIAAAAQVAQDGAHTLVLSGPAGGLVGAAYTAELSGCRRIIGLDMGGTSCDVGLALDGQPRTVPGTRVSGDHPLQTPVLDIHTIGAGGGSVAWIDAGGGLKVGPRSAGARPGPVCYGQGGTGPTVTDANVVLGRLNPVALLDGEMPLDAGAARAAIAELGGRLGLDPVTMALGIIKVSNANMMGAVRAMTTRKGYDPRELTLVAFGGAGPLHAAALAQEIGISTVLVPQTPGLLCALGLLASDLKHDAFQTFISPLDDLDPADISRLHGRMEAAGDATLAAQGVPPDRRLHLRSADLRYLGQEYYLNVPVPSGEVRRADLPALARAFHEMHQRAYGHSAPEEPVELVNLRVASVGRVDKPRLAPGAGHPGAPGPEAAAAAAVRPVYFEEVGDFAATPVYQRGHLPPGTRLSGPVVVEQLDTTTIIHPGMSAFIDPAGNLLITIPRR